MKKILATALFACSLFLATPQVQAYSELDLLEGNWYDDNGKLFAIVRDGKLNTFRMDMITMAGSPGNFAAAVQVQEPNGFRNGTFNTYPMTFLSVYGVGDHFDSIFQVNDHGTEKYFALSLHPTTAGMRISIRRLGVDDWSYASLHQ